MVKEVGIEILATKMGVTGSSLDGEDTTLDVQQGHIESTATKIVDENVALLVGLAGAETVGDSGSGRLVDDTEDVQASNSTGVLGSLTLVVVEVGGNGDDGLLDLLAELGLSNLLHLQRLSVAAPLGEKSCTAHLDENHGGDLLGREDLLLAEVLDLDHGVAALVDDLEGPGLDVLGDGLILKPAANETPDKVSTLCFMRAEKLRITHLTSKTVFSGFMAAWFFAASPIRRSSAVKETKDGVVKLPCSLATVEDNVSMVLVVACCGESY